MSVLEYWNSLELELKMTSAMSQPHSTLSSIAFFISPFLRLVNVTCRQSGVSWAGSADSCQCTQDCRSAFGCRQLLPSRQCVSSHRGEMEEA